MQAKPQCHTNMVFAGSKGDAVVRAITPPTNVTLLLVLSHALRGFSPGTLVFPSPQKPTFPNSNLSRSQVDEEPPCGCGTSKSLFIIISL